MKDINRGAFRITDAARAQHETALAQAVSKILLREECSIEDIETLEDPSRALGVFIDTRIYIKNEMHSYVKTWAPLTNLKDIKTEWVQPDSKK